MNCRQCGVKIPNELLKADSFRCPECGRLYKRKNAQAVVKSEVKSPVAQKKAKKKLGLMQRLKMALTQKTMKLPVWFCVIAAICLVAPVFGGGDNNVASENVQSAKTASVITAEPTQEVLHVVEETDNTLTTAAPVEESVLATSIATEMPIEVSTEQPIERPTEKPTQQPTEKPSATAVPLEKQKIVPGDSGERVAALQKRLIALGYLSGSADGEYGKKTQDAVKAYQKAAGLEQTGVCDYKTYESMTSSSAPKKKSSSKSSSSSSSSGGSVYIAPDSGKKYHSDKNCRGLRNANSIKSISKSSAINKGYGSCGICY